MVGVGFALCATLSACMTSTNARPSTFINECLANRADMQKDIDWAAVQPYRVRVVNGDFRPMIMSLEQNRPYILVLENADAKDHDFWAPDFLKTGVALDSRATPVWRTAITSEWSPKIDSAWVAKVRAAT